MKVIDTLRRSNYEVRLDYIGKVAQIKWQGDDSFDVIDQEQVLKDIFKRLQDIRNSKIFERRFLIKKAFTIQ